MRQNNRSGLHEKGSLNVQAYVDVKKIATIAAFLQDTGELYAPQYGVISQYCINYFMAILEEHFPQHLTRFGNTSEAIHWLDEHRFSMAQFKPTGNRRIARDLMYESESSSEFGSEEYGRHKVLKSSMGNTPQQATNKILSLFEREQAAKTYFSMTGVVPEGFEYLWDSSIPNPHLTEEQRADRAQAFASVAKIMPEMLAQSEARCAPVSEEVRQQNLRRSAVTLLLKNSTSAQQMPVPKELLPFFEDPEVIAEVATAMGPYLAQRERDMIATEEEKKKQVEEKARRQIA